MSERFLRDLAGMKRKWPDIWNIIEFFYVSKGDDSLEWPDWCFIPMGAIEDAIQINNDTMSKVEALPSRP